MGNVDHTKDNYEILENMLMPHYNVFMEYQMKPNAYFYWDEKNVQGFHPMTRILMLKVNKKHTSQNKAKCFISSDYKIYSEALGKPGRSGNW